MTSLVTYSDSTTNANAFASTFAFLPTLKPTQKKANELASHRTGNRRQQCKLDTTHLRTDRRATDNTGLAKVAVQCSADTFVVNQSLVLRINICGENRHLRQARKRYR
jgi:hypothetical protein